MFRGQRLLIKFDGRHGFLTPGHGLTADRIDMPIIDSFKKNAFCEIEVVEFLEEIGKLKANAIACGVGYKEFTSTQLELTGVLKKVTYISFLQLSTSGMLALMEKAVFNPDNAPIPTQKQNSEVKLNSRLEDDSKFYKPLTEPTDNKEELKEFVIRLKLSHPVKDLHFKNGSVAFTKFISEIRRNLEIIILNSFLREEFDAIKNYFSNVLDTKKIEVELAIHLKGDKLLYYSATSPQIDLIDNDLLQRTILVGRERFVKRLKKDLKPSTVYTIDEIFQTIGESLSTGSVLFGKDEEFIDAVCSIEKSKHYKHLRYLSDRHASKTMRVRFITEPFSFLFLIEGKSTFHLVWETLNTTEATYIWHTHKNIPLLQNFWRKVESIISEMAVSGKLSYLSNCQDDFKRIYHDYSSEARGFLNWKDEMEEYITTTDIYS